jgi:hypothetical protein
MGEEQFKRRKLARDVSEPERRALTQLMEECAEVIVAGSKISRFGWRKRNPYEMDGVNNINQLLTEIGNVEQAITRVHALIGANPKLKNFYSQHFTSPPKRPAR